MIVGVGVDLIETHRIQKAMSRKGFLEKYFTQQERELVKENVEKIAGNFASKEAVSKVFSTGFVGFSPKDIEVLRLESGKPYVNLYEGAKKLAQQQNITNIHLSISNRKEYVVAYAVGESMKKEG